MATVIFVYLFFLIKSESPNPKMYIYGSIAIASFGASIYYARLKE